MDHGERNVNAIAKGLPLWTESWEIVKRITGVLELNQKTMNGRRKCTVDGETLESVNLSTKERWEHAHALLWQ